MNSRILFSILVVSILTGMVVTPVVHASTPEDAENWPMFGYDPTRQSYSTSSAPSDNHVKWVWNTTTSEVATSPAVADDYAIVGCEDKVIAFNATTGEVIWTYLTEAITSLVWSSPAIDSGRVFFGLGDTKMYCLDQYTGTLLWDFPTGDGVESSPLVKGGRVFFSSHDGKLYCLNQVNGSLVWEHELKNSTTNNRSSPAANDELVVVGSSTNVFAVNITSGERVWNFTVESSIPGFSSVTSSPAISGERVYFGALHTMYCVNTSSGSLIWNTSIEKGNIGIYLSSPAVANGRVFIGSSSDKVYSFNATTGEILWEYLTDGDVWSSPAVADGKVFVGSNDGRLYCLNETTGGFIWSQYTMGMVRSSPAIAGGTVFVGCGAMDEGGRVYAFGPDETIPTNITLNLDATTGYLGFKVTLSGQLEGNGTAIDGALVVLAYSVDGGQQWNDITSDVTADGGLFSADWVPSATGLFMVRASWAGNYPFLGSGSVKMLSVLPFAEQCMFSVESNSTLSELAFDYTSSNLSFTATGENGTTGYVKVTIAKDLMANITDLKVYLDESNLDYTVTSTETAWILNFVYTHSTHSIVVNLGELNYVPEIGFLSIAFLAAASLLGSLIYDRYKKKT